MAKAVLIPGKEKRVWSGHPWVFRSDIARVEGDFTPGDVVDVQVTKKKDNFFEGRILRIKKPVQVYPTGYRNWNQHQKKCRNYVICLKFQASPPYEKLCYSNDCPHKRKETHGIFHALLIPVCLRHRKS